MVQYFSGFSVPGLRAPLPKFRAPSNGNQIWIYDIDLPMLPGFKAPFYDDCLSWGYTVCIWYDEYDAGIFAYDPYDERHISLKVLEFLNIISRYDELSSL